MSGADSPWSVRLAWCALILAGAFVVTSGFEVPDGDPRNITPSVETTPRITASQDVLMPTQPLEPVRREDPGARGRAINELSIQELEARMKVLEKRLAERATDELTEALARDVEQPVIPTQTKDSIKAVSASGSDSDRSLHSQGSSERDVEVEREATERAEKMVSEIQTQLKQLEAERERQMNDVLDAAR